MEQRLKVLKAMSEVTGHMDMKQFAQAVGLAPSKTIEQVHELAKAGFVKKSGSGYGITEKGKNALKAITPVSAGEEFQFYKDIDQPTGLCANCVKELYDSVTKADAASLEFHLYRGDFENWIRTAINDAAFADELVQIKKTELKGENLRKELVKTAKERYSIEP